MAHEYETYRRDRFHTIPTAPHLERGKQPAVTAGASRTSYHPIKLIRLPDLRKRLGNIGRSTVYDWLNPNSPRHDPSFPVPIKLSYTGGAIAWIESEIDEWLAARVRVR
ncbi:helix-turn-helix transcriptional regulator [Hydrogenophaga palleronii]|uniref:helix-turn-helix transcriptional regulator n=1 Tax=Hydrogenophaga palleronii TaxID=65655 RepID=UPI000A04E63E|nr:AlpA family phage regulatory protein [Hydrogenophaga palleronii]